MMLSQNPTKDHWAEQHDESQLPGKNWIIAKNYQGKTEDQGGLRGSPKGFLGI